jgi:DNA-directed RNA polymerase specialized sigma24 family protein
LRVTTWREIGPEFWLNPAVRTEPPDSEPQAHGGVFATTHWSVVLTAGAENTLQSAAALEQLCRAYWYPLYAYVRRRGYGHEDAQDLTQGFMLQLLARKSFARVHPSRGRFRSFLLAGLNYFLVDERIRAQAQKRGGGQVTLSFVDTQEADARYRLEPVDGSSPDKLFERRWALTLLGQVLARLEQEFCAAGKADLFERLRAYLVANAGEETYAEAAAALGMTHEAFKKAVQRMRQRYYELFRQEIAHTVADAAEVEDEMRHLCAVMAG